MWVAQVSLLTIPAAIVTSLDYAWGGGVTSEQVWRSVLVFAISYAMAFLVTFLVRLAVDGMRRRGLLK